MIQVWCLDITLLEQDDTLTPIASSNFIPSIGLSTIQEVPLISSSSAQDSGYNITLDKLFEQFHITYGAYSFYQSKFFQTAQLKHLIKKILDHQGDGYQYSRFVLSYSST
ncbi:unknown [Rickettsia conorii str. Malish 7]|uniref:Uncharacterized protein n=1 Tax=Rickettsia conorii (strain ATCC VR-613 / Malish 7) TaxID=272944 RepID=Q92HB2_RICCN|nr:unknown [Rickettsia conorii str. Malish 7]